MRTQLWGRPPVRWGPPSGPRPPRGLPRQHRLEGWGTVGGSQEATPSVSSLLFLQTWDFTAL